MEYETIIYVILNVLLFLVISPFFMGLIKKVKALCQRRKGPRLMQPYYNLLKLFKKEVVVSKDASWITHATPYINISFMIVAVLFVPLFFIPHTNTVLGNILLFIYILAVSKFFMSLVGLDAGSTFGGMGSSREMSFSSIIEPVTMIVFLALTYIFKSTNFFDIMRTTSTQGVLSTDSALILLAISLFIILIVESSRVPVDNPETHLELTMIHEAMILEQSGRNLALMELSSAIKQALLMTVLINIFFPFGLTTELGIIALLAAIALFIFKGVLLSIIIGLFESYLSKSRLFALPSFFIIPFFLAFLALVIEVFA